MQGIIGTGFSLMMRIFI